LITNGDFDTDGNWNNFGTPTTSEQSTERSYIGTYSWKIIADATREGIFSPNNFNLTSGRTYTVSLWIYSVSGNSILSGLTNTNASVFTARTVTVGEWTNITYQAIATSTSASYISVLSNSSLNFFIDNVSVKEYLGQEVVPDSGCGSWLLEPQSTNLITQSELFSDSSWVNNNYTLTPNSIISPSGALNAFKITLGTVNGALRTQISVLSSTNYVFSFYAKRGTASEMKYRVFDFTNSSDIVPKTSYYSQTNLDTWVRIEVPFTSSTIANVGCYIDSDSQGNGDFYIWGAQVEEKSFSTSYIPTSGATNTRNQDLATNSGNATLINSTEGVLYAEIAALSNEAIYREISLSDGTTNNVVEIRYTPIANQFQFVVRNSGAAQVVTTITLSNALDFNKIAFSFKSNDYKMYVNGSEVGTDLSGTMPSGLNTLSFDWAGNNKFFGKNKALAVYKEALTDAELQSLTTL